MEPGLGIPCHDVDDSPEAPLVSDVEGPLRHLDPLHLGEVDVERRRVHVVGTGSVDAVTVDEDVEVAALHPPQDDVIGDAPLSQGPQARNRREGLTHVPRAALPDRRRLEAVRRNARAHVDAFGEGGQGQPEILLHGGARFESDAFRRTGEKPGLSTRRSHTPASSPPIR